MRAGDSAEGGGRDALFGHLPVPLFAVLGSAARRAYARLILAIYRRFFADGFAELHRRDEVVEFIKSEYERHADLVEEFASDAHNADVSRNPLTAYRTLVDGGWLVEHSRGYVAAVDLDASVSMLLETLSAIEEGEAVHFGGTLAAIESVVAGLREAPVERAAALADTAQRSRRFQQHLSAVMGSLRSYEIAILARPDPAHILARFFDDFVERVLIAAYRSLKVRNNPFRHRDRIVAAVGGYEADADCLEKLAAGYIRHGLATDKEGALVKVRQHLGQVRTTFVRVEDRLDEIDAFRVRLERRITRTISYMNQVDATLPARLMAGIQGLAARLPGWSDAVPVASDLADPVRAWGTEHLWTPRSRRGAAAPSAVRVVEPDPVITEWDRAKREYLARLVVTPEKIVAFLEAALDGRDSVDAAELDVPDTERALVFQRLRLLDVLGDRDLGRRYRVVPLGGLVQTQWSVCTDFCVERVESGSDERRLADAG